MGFFGPILYLLHCLLSIKTAISQFFLGSRKLLDVAYQKRQPDLTKDSKSLTKLPIHVGLLICEDISYNDITNLCAWCIGMGISYISLYDPNGVLKRNQSQIYSELTKLLTKTLGDKSKMNIHINSGLESSVSQQEFYQSCPAKIHVLSPEDGKQYLVEITRQLCEQTTTQQRPAADITLMEVQNYIEENQGFPDPDLLIRFGSVDCLLGFLPWHIRLSEILHLPSHREINYKTFLRTLQGYANSQQRFGK